MQEKIAIVQHLFDFWTISFLLHVTLLRNNYSRFLVFTMSNYNFIVYICIQLGSENHILLVYWNSESIVQTWKSKKLWLKGLGRIVYFHSRSRTTYFDYCAILLWHQTIKTVRTIGLRKLIGFKLSSEYKLNLKPLGEWNPKKNKGLFAKGLKGLKGIMGD